MQFWISCAISVLLTMIATEFSELGPLMAGWIVTFSARLLLDRELGKQYAEEWRAGINGLPGKLIPLVKAIGILVITVPVLNNRYLNELWICTIGIRSYSTSLRRGLRYSQRSAINGHIPSPEIMEDYNLFVDEICRLLKEGSPDERSEAIEVLEVILDNPPAWVSKFCAKWLWRRDLPMFQKALSARGYL